MTAPKPTRPTKAQRDTHRDVTQALDLVTKSARIIQERIATESYPTELVGVWNDLQHVMEILTAIDARTGRRDPTRRGAR